MWTLLRVSRPDAGDGATGAEGFAVVALPEPPDAYVDVTEEPDEAITVSERAITVPPVEPHGAGAVGNNGSVSKPRVRISMCPGGVELGMVALERAAEQFDFSVAERFQSRGEAERACAQRTGFLLEIQEADEPSRTTAVLFVATLRA